MAFFSVSTTTARPQFKLGFPSTPAIPFTATVKLFPTCSPLSSTFRGRSSRRLQIKQRLLSVSATNPSSRSGKSPSEGSQSQVNETGTAGQGPPLLTILAGLFVFFIISWTIGSIIMWLISLIVNVPSPK